MNKEHHSSISTKGPYILIHYQVLKQDQQKLKLQAYSLFLKLSQLKDKLKQYSKLKKKWNKFKNILRYSKYPIAILFCGADIVLSFILIVGISLALIINEYHEKKLLVLMFEKSFVKFKVNTYVKKWEHITK